MSRWESMCIGGRLVKKTRPSSTKNFLVLVFRDTWRVLETVGWAQNLTNFKLLPTVLLKISVWPENLTFLNLNLKPSMRNWGDDPGGNSAWSTSMRTWFQVSSTHVKSLMNLSGGGRQRQEDCRALLTTSLTPRAMRNPVSREWGEEGRIGYPKSSFGIYVHAHICAYIPPPHTHTPAFSGCILSLKWSPKCLVHNPKSFIICLW